MYEELIENLSLKKGDRIWLSSEVIKLAFMYKFEGLEFNPDDFLESFQVAIGDSGTLILPTFSFEFSNKGYYDYKNTKGITGALGNVALNRRDFLRTLHPMHSFAVWGKDKEYLCSLDNINSFGNDSLFAFCADNNVKQVVIGTDYVHAFTFVHYAEYICDVPYRFQKSFVGDYVDANGDISRKEYQYFARKLEYEPVEKFNKIGAILEKENVAKKINVRGITCLKIDLAKSLPIICNDIKNNQCKNIYDFNISRDEIFRQKEIV